MLVAKIRGRAHYHPVRGKNDGFAMKSVVVPFDDGDAGVCQRGDAVYAVGVVAEDLVHARGLITEAGPVDEYQGFVNVTPLGVFARQPQCGSVDGFVFRQNLAGVGAVRDWLRQAHEDSARAGAGRGVIHDLGDPSSEPIVLVRMSSLDALAGLSGASRDGRRLEHVIEIPSVLLAKVILSQVPLRVIG